MGELKSAGVNQAPALKSYQVTFLLIQMGFSQAFSELVGQEMNTDFTADWMLRYLEAAHPDAMEQIADEMLEILEWREQYIKRRSRFS